VRHHFYETYDLTEQLRGGENVIAAQVLSYSSTVSFPPDASAPTSIMYFANAFALSGEVVDANGVERERIDSNDQWRALKDDAYVYSQRPGWHTFLGMFEDVYGDAYPHGWETVAYDDSAWEPAHAFYEAFSFPGDVDSELPHRLIPRIIPQLEEIPCRFDGVAQPDNTSREAWQALIRDDAPVTVPANTEASITVWCDALTTGFPTVETDGGECGDIALTYSEGLYFEATETDRGLQSPKHDPENGVVLGYWDVYRAGGGSERYEPFHWRTFRYLRVKVTTGMEPLTIRRFTYRFTGYPFVEKASFSSSDPSHARMWEMAWRTARLCAHETYEDCPYHEQLQYAGDTQVQCLLSYYVTGDERLARQAIRHFDWSRDNEGLTKSRYPSMCEQNIPGFSLLWMVMVRDFWWHTGDVDEARERLPGMLTTLGWFARHENADGLLEALPYWQFVDWVKEWKGRGVPPGADGGVSATMNFEYAWALRCVAEVAEGTGDSETAASLNRRADHIVATLDRVCWWSDEGVYRDNPKGEELSERTNAFAVLAGSKHGKTICKRLGRDSALAAATLYGRYYLFRALDKSGAYQVAPALLDHWYKMMETDLTTFAENPFPARSFCHAWSAGPLYEFLAQILGVKPSEPGWKRIRIKPHLWDLTHASGVVPTPSGPISVSWKIDNGAFVLDVSGPGSLPMEVVLPDGSVHEMTGQQSFTCAVS